MFQFLQVNFCFVSLFFLAVKQKEALERESKLSILEAGVADVSLIAPFPYFLATFATG